MYEYKARLVRVVDGDTFEFEVDLGFGIRFKEMFRLFGADTPEIFGRNATEEGRVAKDVVERLFNFNGPELIICTYKDRKGKYGRYLVDVFITFDENGNPLLTPLNEYEGTRVTLSQYLIMSGIARAI